MASARPAQVIADRAVGRDNHFNLIRMIAATGVLVSHAYPIALGPGAVQPLEPWLKGITLGTVCVYIFFAISGFFIAKSFDRSPGLKRFLMARVLRLYPALIVVLGLTALLAGPILSTAAGDVYWGAVPDYLAGNLSLYRLRYDLPGVFETNVYGPAINGSLWTLFYEVACYGGVVLAGLSGLLHRKRVLAVLLVLFVILCVVAPALPLPGKIAALLDLALPFAIGTGFYVWRDVVPLRLSLGLGLTGLAGLLAYNRLGDYSYGMYIYAFPVQQAAIWGGITTPLANMAVALPTTLILAIISWHLVEKPALALIRQAGPETGKSMA